MISVWSSLFNGICIVHTHINISNVNCPLGDIVYLRCLRILTRGDLNKYTVLVSDVEAMISSFMQTYLLLLMRERACVCALHFCSICNSMLSCIHLQLGLVCFGPRLLTLVLYACIVAHSSNILRYWSFFPSLSSINLRQNLFYLYPFLSPLILYIIKAQLFTF